MKIFVTGGTGSVGDILVQNLLDSNHDVTVITRDKNHVDNTWKDQVQIVEGDVTQPGDWLDHLAGQDGIVNLVGENIFGKRWTEKQKQRILHSRSDPAEILVNHIKSMDNPPSVVVSVSGTDYYPTSEDQIFEEDDPRGDGFLADVCEAWESPIRSLKESGVRHVIYRMGVAFGYSGGGAERMFLTHKFFVGGWVGSGSQIYSWIHIRDFAGLLQWGLEHNEIEGTYNGVAPEYKSMKELAEIGGTIMGRWTWTWAPGFMLKLVLGERAKLLLKGRAVSSEKVRDAGYQFKFPDAESALADILEDF